MSGIKRKSGVYIHNPNQGFQKGHKLLRKNPVWCKGKKGIKTNNKGGIPWNKGLTKETDERVKKYSENGSITQKGKHNSINTEWKKGKKPWNINKKLSDEHKKKLSSSWDYNKHFTDKTRKKLRERRLNELKEYGVNVQTGKNEKEILDYLEQLFNIKIIRQYSIIGYSIDGYIPELNLCIEVDEKHHYNDDGSLKEKDMIRQKEIENKLNCNFLRIKDKLNMEEI